jgi:oxygen-dependent protoporphyrinogen oxidase
MTSQTQALVVGAGISGLSAAFALQKSGITTILVEASHRPGGVIQSIRRDGYLLECGPQSFSASSPMAALCDELNLTGECVLADPKAPRYIFWNGTLEPVPASPGALLNSPLLAGGRAAILRDALGKTTPPEPDESVADFMRRKFSATLLDRLAGPIVSGIYAGDPEKLSLRSALPLLYEAEKKSGSVLRGMFSAKMSAPSAPAQPVEKRTVQSFREGNETLVRALAAVLGSNLRLNVEAISIQPLDCGHEAKAPRFRITLRTQQGTELCEAERLILAVPTSVAANLLAPLDPLFESQFSAFDYPPVAVVSLGYRLADLGRKPDGFGFLVPRSSGLTILGTVWNSSLFPGRAPDGHGLFTTFVGGATNPAAALESAEALAALVHRELASVLTAGRTTRNTTPPAPNFSPAFSNSTLWPRAIPQYNLGHSARVAALDAACAKFPGLYLAGNFLSGPALANCLSLSHSIANAIRITFAN